MNFEEDALTPERFINLATALDERLGSTSDMVVSAILLAHHFNVAQDSRSLAKELGIEHALILRAISQSSPKLLTITRKDNRTQRQWFEPTALAKAQVCDLLSSL